MHGAILGEGYSGAGFIGSALIRHLLNKKKYEILNIDKLNYAGNIKTLKTIKKNKKYSFEKIDICDSTSLKRVFYEFLPHGIIHLLLLNKSKY